MVQRTANDRNADPCGSCFCAACVACETARVNRGDRNAAVVTHMTRSNKVVPAAEEEEAVPAAVVPIVAAQPSARSALLY